LIEAGSAVRRVRQYNHLIAGEEDAGHLHGRRTKMTELLVRYPLRYAAERAYILDVVLGEFLGLSFEAIPEARDDVVVSVPAESTGIGLRIADDLFQTRRDDWLDPASLPTLPLDSWAIPTEIRAMIGGGPAIVPVLYGQEISNASYFARTKGGIDLGLDIFGSAFFMLSRYEEACPTERDSHGRFAARASIAVQAGFLERPIVNEYLEILWACLTLLCPTIKRRPRHYRALVSHDVDRMFTTRNASWRTVIRNSVGDLTRRTDPILAARRIRSRFHSGKGDYRFEPTNTFDFIMDCSERHGIESAFYWIAQDGGHELDADYSLDMHWVRHLMKHISDRGHELGLHGSYESHDRPEQIRAEMKKLISAADRIGVHQTGWGGRQHYLRWEAGSTWQYWDDAGLDYDSTLTYPEAAGFRCGICYEYPVFNVLQRKQLHLRERPLVAMEVSLMSDVYMGLSSVKMQERIVSLANKCRRYDGDFTLLWHNDNLVQSWQRRLYRQVIASISP